MSNNNMVASNRGAVINQLQRIHSNYEEMTGCIPNYQSTSIDKMADSWQSQKGAAKTRSLINLSNEFVEKTGARLEKFFTNFVSAYNQVAAEQGNEGLNWNFHRTTQKFNGDSVKTVYEDGGFKFDWEGYKVGLESLQRFMQRVLKNIVEIQGNLAGLSGLGIEGYLNKVVENASRKLGEFADQAQEAWSNQVANIQQVLEQDEQSSKSSVDKGASNIESEASNIDISSSFTI